MAQPTIHASAVVAGRWAVLIRGPSGSGKSRLALGLIEAAGSGALPFARLVGDDRVHTEAVHGRLMVRPAATLAGQIEIRGLGIRQVEHETVAVVGLVVDLSATDADRMPAPTSLIARISGIHLPRLPVAAGVEPLPLVLNYLRDGPNAPPPKPAGPAADLAKKRPI